MQWPSWGGGILVYRSYALYQENKSYNVLRGTIPDFSSGDIELTFTINGQVVEQAFPGKNDGYVANIVTCENEVTAEWDNTNWGLVSINSNNSKKVKCNVDFKESQTLIKYLKNLNSSTLVEDDFGNIRYIGYNPNNYVSFNNELWRIIGVMKDIENPDGSKEDKVKIIRSESIGKYSWNSNMVNNWSKASLKSLLNEGDYYNRTNSFENTGLTYIAKDMISESVWNLGGSSTISKIASEFYTLERGTTVSSGSSTKWTGNVGLMYPSDYGYATSGGTTTDRNTCLNTTLDSWKSDVSYCKNNDWLLDRSNEQWTIMPWSSRTSSVFHLTASGYLSDTNFASTAYAARPVVYLKSETVVESGAGTNTNPIILKAG